MSCYKCEHCAEERKARQDVIAIIQSGLNKWGALRDLTVVQDFEGMWLRVEFEDGRETISDRKELEDFEKYAGAVVQERRWQ